MPHPEFSTEQRGWYQAATSQIDVERMRRLNREITAIHSPTGRERAASEYMTRYLADAGLEARYQPMGEQSGNAVGRIRGSGGGSSLLLYAPIDTHLEGNDEDIPWVGPGLRADMVPQVQEQVLAHATQAWQPVPPRDPATARPPRSSTLPRAASSSPA